MPMKRRDIVIGSAVLLLLVGVVYYRQSRKPQETKVPETLSVENQLEDKFKVEIPEDVDKAELKDVSGGNGSAIATRKYEEDKFTSTVLADLPEVEAGKFYQAWLVKGKESEEGYETLSLGKLVIAKGGWMLEFQGNKDLSDYSQVLISLEEKSDTTPEKRILEGNF